MAELGEASAAAHEEVGALAARAGVTALVVVGDEAAPILAGAKAEPGWHGDLVHVPDARAAVRAISGLLAPGDVVLVKASRAAGLEQVALAADRGSRLGMTSTAPVRWRREDDPRRGRGVSRARAAWHAARDPCLPQARLRPGDQGGRAGRARHQARHAHHGRHSDHHRVAGRLLRRARRHAVADVGLRPARARPDDRARFRRLRRRLHQDLQAAQPRPAQRREVRRPGRGRRGVRAARAAFPGRLRHHARRIRTSRSCATSAARSGRSSCCGWLS